MTHHIQPAQRLMHARKMTRQVLSDLHGACPTELMGPVFPLRSAYIRLLCERDSL